MAVSFPVPSVEVIKNDGESHFYEVKDGRSPHEHAKDILKKGYRHKVEDSNIIEWYPPAYIEKVRVYNSINL